MAVADERRQDHLDAMAHLRQLEMQLAALSRELGDTRVHNEHEIADIKEEIERFCASKLVSPCVLLVLWPQELC